MHAGRNIPFGIREHAMGAIVNGAAAHGGIVKPYGSTFLMFSDYMRGGGAPVGADGAAGRVGVDARLGRARRGRPDAPADRALRGAARDPDLWVIRPADANETVAAWRVALEREDGPVALLLSRQDVAVLDRAELGAAEELERGGYVLWDSRRDGDALAAAPELILISTGAEVPPTLAGRAEAGRRGAKRARRVDAVHGAVRSPDAGVPRQVLPPAATARLAVEPGATMSWWKWVGIDGDVLGLDRFGASAPGTTVLEKLGFTAENIAARARARCWRAKEADAADESLATAATCPRSARACGSTSSRANRSAAGTCGA